LVALHQPSHKFVNTNVFKANHGGEIWGCVIKLVCLFFSRSQKKPKSLLNWHVLWKSRVNTFSRTSKHGEFLFDYPKKMLCLNIKPWFWKCIKILTQSHKLPITFNFFSTWIWGCLVWCQCLKGWMSWLNFFNFNNVFVYVACIIKLCQINPYFWYNDPQPQLAGMDDVFTRYQNLLSGTSNVLVHKWTPYLNMSMENLSFCIFRIPLWCIVVAFKHFFMFLWFMVFSNKLSMMIKLVFWNTN
jgi:hypothetical protein